MTEKADKAAESGRESRELNDLREAFEFGSTYVTTVPTQASVAFGAAPTSNLQQRITQAVQGVLGRSFKPGDHASFRAALQVSFEYKEIEGKPVYEWKPRAYPSVGATDIGGGISGAQYSLVSFATALHERAEPLIENLHTLDTSVDDEELDAAKAIFATAWDEFVEELSREGGPRASRANLLAKSIFNFDSPEFKKQPQNFDLVGNVGRLGRQLGMIKTVASGPGPRSRQITFDRSKVVTSEEEGYLTSFIALTDYTSAVVQAWENYRDTFLGKDLGSGLLLMERALAVVEDGVNEVYEAMDSVSVDQAERLVIPIGFAAPDDGLTVEDFLSWIAAFASREAPELIREAGIRGIQAVIPTADKLSLLTADFVNLITNPPVLPAPPSLLPRQFRHSRVLNPLDELGRYLKTLVEQAKDMITE